MTWTEISEQLPDWRITLDRLHLSVKATSFAQAVEFVNRVAQLADEAGHHPDIDLRYDTVHLALVTHSKNAITDADVALAGKIAEVVGELGLQHKRARIQETEIAIDTLDQSAIIDFWAAVMHYEVAADSLVDPLHIGPSIWFQKMEEPRVQRNRIHLDVSVPHDEAQGRIRAAVAAGGRVVSDAAAPAFTVLADAEGNEVCICTWQSRGQ